MNGAYTIGHMNITLELFGALVALLIAICLLTGTDKKSKLTRLFMRIVLCTMAALICDAAAWAFDGNKTAIAFIIVRAAKFLTYSLSYLLIPLLTDYVVALIGRNIKIPQTIVRVMYVLCGAAILLVAVSQFNHMYYDFDENNMYRVQGLFWLSQALGVLFLFIDTVAILRYRKHISRDEILFLLSYAIFPLLAMIIQTFIWEQFEFLFIAVTLSIVACYGGVQAQQAKLLKQKELELTQGKIDIMLSQLQPHFMFNSLAAIQRLCTKDPKLAEETVIQFTRYLRGNLDSLSVGKPIPFEKELALLEDYLAIEKKRFGQRLRINCDISVRDFMIPALTLQSVVENAVRHGVTKREEGGTVTISVSETETDVVLTVSDDGVGFVTDSQDGRRHIGIENIRSRLTSMCGGTLTITSTPGVGTTAVITIPKV